MDEGIPRNWDAGRDADPAKIDREHRADLHSLARRSGLAEEDAKDVVQETLIDAIDFINSGRFRGECSVRTLVLRIFRRRVADYRRGRLRESAAFDLSKEGAESLLSHSSLEPAVAPQHDTRLVVRETLMALPDEHRFILVMNQMGGYTIKQIGVALGRSKGRTGAMLAEAKRMFREKLI